MHVPRTPKFRPALAGFALAGICYLGAEPGSADSDPTAARRREMVETQIRARGIDDARVLRAMSEVPRHRFVPPAVEAQAYEDYPLPIGAQQTISQPYIVALMTSLLELEGGEKVLEIGTGSGYQAAVLARVAGEVYTIEILQPLAESARRTITDLGYSNVQFRVGDGYAGWPEAAPFDAIVVTAAPEKVPQPLLDQLRVGGRLVIPVGSFFQNLMVYTKTASGFEKKNVIPVRFVPMTGKAQKPSR
ncbi:MAG: protein-L-isoaspartate(D-aspartate) O-methyltransferase [Thermoanaerobaculia bacterium]